VKGRIAALSACAVLALGCAFVPQSNRPIDELRIAYAAAAAEPLIARQAPGEWSLAEATYQEALASWGTLQDPAAVDHLAYLARQRIAIAHEASRRVSAEEALASARKRRETAL
jgi:hypothetical protein